MLMFVPGYGPVLDGWLPSCGPVLARAESFVAGYGPVLVDVLPS